MLYNTLTNKQLPPPPHTHAQHLILLHFRLVHYGNWPREIISYIASLAQYVNFYVLLSAIIFIADSIIVFFSPLNMRVSQAG